MAKYNLYILSILNILCILYILSILNKLEDVQHNQDSTYTRCTTLFNRIPAPVYAGALYWLPGTLPGQYAAGSIKTAKFLPEFGLKNDLKNAVMVAINQKLVSIIYYYRNHRIPNTPKITINRIYQMINDLKLGQINSDNFSLVQGCMPIMPNMALSAWQEKRQII